MRLFKTLPIVVALIFSLAGCGPSKTDMVREVAEAMEAGLPADLAKLEFEVSPGPEIEGSESARPKPMLVYQRKNSKILATNNPELNTEGEVVINVLARTNKGNYFTFTYVSALRSIENKITLGLSGSGCTEEKCRQFRHVGAASVAAAKSIYFDMATFTPERYKEIFNETAPPKRIIG